MSILGPLDEDAWNAWVATRPEVIQKMCRSHPPNRLYRLPGGSRATIYSYSEDGTMTLNVTGQFNLVAFSRQVFGVKPEDLVECELPGPEERLGDMGMDPLEALERLPKA